MADDSNNRGREDARRSHLPEWDSPGSERHDVGRRGGWDFGDPYDQRNYDSGGFGFGGTSGSAGGFGVGGNGPQSGGYGSQGNCGQGAFSHGDRGTPGPYDLNEHERGGRPGRGGSNPEHPYWGQGRGRPYGEGWRARDRHHEQYLSWRDAQIRNLDLEYEDYRREHQAKFDEDFGSWRDKRAAERNPTAGGAAAEVAKKSND